MLQRQLQGGQDWVCAVQVCYDVLDQVSSKCTVGQGRRHCMQPGNPV